MFALKEYQQRCLDELAGYFRRVIAFQPARVKPEKMAFEEADGRAPYQPVKELPGLPYICLRVPTGGGKTVMASHAVGVACREYLHRERCLVFWLAPSTQIVSQTVKALQDKRHPYRQPPSPPVHTHLKGRYSESGQSQPAHLSRPYRAR